MIEKNLILIADYCNNSRAEKEFLLSLEQEGLIRIEEHDERMYITEDQLSTLEIFTRLYYDLSINIEGIDVINTLLQKMNMIEMELNALKRELGHDFVFQHEFFEEQ